MTKLNKNLGFLVGVAAMGLKKDAEICKKPYFLH